MSNGCACGQASQGQRSRTIGDLQHRSGGAARCVTLARHLVQDALEVSTPLQCVSNSLEET